MNMLVSTFVILGIIITIIVICTLCTFIYYFSADISFWLRAKRIRKIEGTPVIPCVDTDTFSAKLLSTAKQMIDSGRKLEFPTITAPTFTERARIFWKTQDSADIFNLEWAECGWLFYAMAESGYDLEYIKRVFDEKIINTSFRITDQCPGGMVSISLYLKTHEQSYKDYADRMYNWLVAQDTEFGILYRKNAKFQLVDVVGMVVPYLIYYGTTFNVPNAITIAYKTIEKYIYYGCDSKTGMPVFEYSVSYPYIKSGASDWGRGLSWFIIGCSYIDIEKLDAESKNVILQLNKCLLELWNNNNSFGHFIGQGGRDLSAELPIVYYLLKKRLIPLSKEQVLSYSALCHDGLMFHNSSSNHGLVKYGQPWGYNSLSQAYMLRIIFLNQRLNSK